MSLSAVESSPPSAPTQEPAHAPFQGWGFRRRPTTGGLVQELGATGLVRYGDEVSDEWHHALRGSRAAKVFREMGDNDSNVGASFHLIDSHVRSVGWHAEEAKDHPQAEEAAKFLTEVFDDMSHTWVDSVSEMFSMNQFGWSAFEKVYKYRNGPDAPAEGRSKFTDGKVGVRKLSIRAQETLDGWDFDDEGSLRGMWQRASPKYERVLIPIEKLILFRPRQSKGNPEGKSPLRPAFRSWFFLKRLEELEAIKIERDAVGLIHMQLPTSYFDSGAPQDKKNAVTAWAKTVSQVRRNEHEGVVTPCEEDAKGKTGYKLSVIQSAGGPGQADIGAAITRHRQSIGQVLLTQFIFMGMDKIGTQALSSSIIDVFLTSLAVLLDVIEELINRFLVAEIMELNGYPRECWPRWKHADVKKADVTTLTKSLLDLVNAGLLTPDDKLEEFLRLEARLPERDEEDEELDEDGKPKKPDGGLPRGDDETNKDAAATVSTLTAAIDKLARMGDVDLCNAARNALAMVLGLENPAPLTAADLTALNKPDPLDGGGGPGNAPPGGKPKTTKKPKSST